MICLWFMFIVISLCPGPYLHFLLSLRNIYFMCIYREREREREFQNYQIVQRSIVVFRIQFVIHKIAFSYKKHKDRLNTTVFSKNV